LKLGPVRPSSEHTLAPGRIAADAKTVLAGTATADVELGTVQPPGRRPISAPDWARGARPAPDESFD
jgi:methionyl-tRNA formyltransferase